jgi:hypothetical protein
MNLAPIALGLALLALPHPAAARPVERPARSGPWSVVLEDEHGRALPTFQHRGGTWVLGQQGRRYAVHVRNHGGQRVEVVVSVDGRDVVDGRPSALGKRGYLVDPYGEVVIDGFRLSRQAVAAFRFSSVARSYAARMGDARDVGVIGVAVFPERAPAPPPPWSGRSDGWGEGRASSEPAPAEAGAPSADLGAAPGASARREKSAERPGLGTGFGERRDSPVTEVAFVRASERPAALLTLRYDDRDGLLAQGIDLDRGSPVAEAHRRRDADPFRRDGRYAEPPPGW